ncbi:hypothetical protein R1flu_017157 [Riccia fluitans]|uniref:Uncharacterized protein n=1 Tax=Riccia fluitans TaxID=41844 RepID=A0ABD1XE47_9MARC
MVGGLWMALTGASEWAGQKVVQLLHYGQLHLPRGVQYCGGCFSGFSLAAASTVATTSQSSSQFQQKPDANRGAPCFHRAALDEDPGNREPPECLLDLPMSDLRPWWNYLQMHKVLPLAGTGGNDTPSVHCKRCQKPSDVNKDRLEAGRGGRTQSRRSRRFFSVWKIERFCAEIATYQYIRLPLALLRTSGFWCPEREWRWKHWRVQALPHNKKPVPPIIKKDILCLLSSIAPPPTRQYLHLCRQAIFTCGSFRSIASLCQINRHDIKQACGCEQHIGQPSNRSIRNQEKEHNRVSVRRHPQLARMNSYIPELGEGYSLGDIASSKADQAILDDDWTADSACSTSSSNLSVPREEEETVRSVNLQSGVIVAPVSSIYTNLFSSVPSSELAVMVALGGA